MLLEDIDFKTLVVSVVTPFHPHMHFAPASAQSSNCDNPIYRIIEPLRYFLFNLIKEAESRHNKIMVRVRCPEDFCDGCVSSFKVCCLSSY